MAVVETTVLAGRAALAESLADTFTAGIRLAVAQRGHAVLALSGGRTPLAFFEALRTRPLPWDKVTVTLVDERCVPHDHPRSNTAFVRTHLLQDHAAAATFLSPVTETGAPILDLKLPARIDMAHFGMGTDGHTASWFPEGDALGAALADEGPALLALSAPGAPEPRLTFTWAALRTARSAVLHFEGSAKAAVFAEAVKPGPMAALPVRRLLHQDDVEVLVFTDIQPPETP